MGPWGTFGSVWTQFGLSQFGDRCATGIQWERPGVLLTILEGAEQAHHSFIQSVSMVLRGEALFVKIK